MLNQICFMLLILVQGVAAPALETGSIEVQLDGLRGGKGQVTVSLYSSAEGFPIKFEKAYKQLRQSVEGGTATLVFEGIPFGTYAVSVWHDENDNKKIDTNAIGFPKEGRGLSNNVKPKFGPPRFSDAKFELQAPKKKIVINMIY